MRALLAAAAFVTSLTAASGAHATAFEVPALHAPVLAAITGIDLSHAPAWLDRGDRADLDAHGDVQWARKSYVIPQRYAFAYDDTRAFWFAAGASAAVSLGTHVLIGLPTSIIGVVSIIGLTGTAPAVTVPLLCGLAGLYILGHAGAAGLVSGLVFNGMSTFYDGSLLASVGGHLLGDVLAAGVVGLMFGGGLLLIGGLSGLAVFTGSAGLNTVYVLSFLGALPAVVVAGVALVAVPALIGAWALAASAQPKTGYAIAPDWKRPVGAPDTSMDGESPATSSSTATSREDTRALPLVRIAVF